MPLHTFIVVNSAVACEEAQRRCVEIGFTPLLLTTMLKGKHGKPEPFLAPLLQRSSDMAGRFPLPAPSSPAVRTQSPSLAPMEKAVPTRNSPSLPAARSLASAGR